MLAIGNGDLWLMSTPRGRRGFFWEAWAHGGTRWERFSVPATECPRISREFLEEERAAMGERWFRQEFLCDFLDVNDGVFDRELIEAAFGKKLKPLNYLESVPFLGFSPRYPWARRVLGSATHER
jgi:hypothetical protein